jgi:SMI1 / KNR4 family (SUKH-1)
MSDEEQFWDEIGPRNPPLSPEQLREWEEQHGIRLPSTLARALMIQDGGCVRGTEGLLWIEPLTRFESLDLPQWEYLWEYEESQKFGDPERIIFIGNHEASRLLLDYNVGEAPRILWIDEDEMHTEEESQTFDELIQLFQEPQD